MKTVWKYQLTLGQINELHMPVGAKFILVEQQGVDQLCAWFEVPLDKDYDRQAGDDYVYRDFYVHGTGDRIADDEVHLGSFLQSQGVFVWHLYERERQ